LQIEFTWSRSKAKRNLAKHGVSFEAAQQAFFDPNLIVVEDCEDDRGEMRYHAIGRAATQLLLLVVFVDRSEEDREIVHIVSARKATAYEERTYSDQF